MKLYKMFRPTLLLCFVALSFANCNKENANTTTVPPALASSTNVTESVSEPTGYILMGNKVNSNLNQIREKNAELGATETGYISKINQMYVLSTNPNFTSTMESLGVTVGIDFKIASPKITTRTIGNLPNASAVANRSAGTLANAVASTASSAWFTAGRSAWMGRGDSVSDRTMRP